MYTLCIRLEPETSFICGRLSSVYIYSYRRVSVMARIYLWQPAATFSCIQNINNCKITLKTLRKQVVVCVQL